MASVKDVREKAKVLGLGVSITRPGDGATRYSFYRRISGEPHVEGRTVGWAKGAKHALIWLDGFAEGLEHEVKAARDPGDGGKVAVSRRRPEEVSHGAV